MPLVEVGRYFNSWEAHLVKARLEAGGVESVLFDTGINLIEGAPMLFPVRLMVLDEDERIAREVLGAE